MSAVSTNHEQNQADFGFPCQESFETTVDGNCLLIQKKVTHLNDDGSVGIDLEIADVRRVEVEVQRAQRAVARVTEVLGL